MARVRETAPRLPGAGAGLGFLRWCFPAKKNKNLTFFYFIFCKKMGGMSEETSGNQRVPQSPESPPGRPPKIFSQSPDPTAHGGGRVIPSVRAIEANLVPHAGSSAAS